MQKNASALLLLTWNETSYKGVIPGKLFEYMAIKNVPIIALVTGDVADSEVAMMIRTCGAGYVAEEANLNVEEFKKYVLSIFRGEVSLSGNSDIYDYKNISRNYAEFIKEK